MGEGRQPARTEALNTEAEETTLLWQPLTGNA
jgi:hypothetical protein